MRIHKRNWPHCIYRLRKLAIVKEVEVQLQIFLASSFLSLALESNNLMHFVEKIQVSRYLENPYILVSLCRSFQ